MITTHVTSKDLTVLFRQLKNSAIKRGIEFNLDLSDLNEISFPITCPILGMPLHFNRGKVEDNSYSVDRMDSTQGYTIDNIIIVSYRANRLKSDATLKELKNITEFYSLLEEQM